MHNKMPVPIVPTKAGNLNKHTEVVIVACRGCRGFDAILQYLSIDMGIVDKVS